MSKVVGIDLGTTNSLVAYVKDGVPVVIRDLRGSGAPPDEWRGRLALARQPIEAKRVEHEAQLQELAARWDAGGGPDVLKALRDQFLERNYIHNLLEGIEREQNA